MSLFQNYRLFLGLYSKNIATYWELKDCRWNESRAKQLRKSPAASGKGKDSRLYDGCTRGEHSPFLCVFYHRKGYSGFLTLEAADLDERGVADKFGDVLVYHNFKY